MGRCFYGGPNPRRAIFSTSDFTGLVGGFPDLPKANRHRFWTYLGEIYLARDREFDKNYFFDKFDKKFF